MRLDAKNQKVYMFSAENALGSLERICCDGFDFLTLSYVEEWWILNEFYFICAKQMVSVFLKVIIGKRACQGLFSFGNILLFTIKVGIKWPSRYQSNNEPNYMYTQDDIFPLHIYNF